MFSMFYLLKLNIKSFLLKFLLATAVIGFFYYTLYYYAPQQDIAVQTQERLALQNIKSKLEQVNQTFNDTSRYSIIDNKDFIHSVALYRERIINAIALGKDIRIISEQMLKSRPGPFSKALLALALKMPWQTYTVNQNGTRQSNDTPYLKAQEALNEPEITLNYILESQKALRNLFEYIPELDFRGLSVSNGRPKFADRLNRAEIGLGKTIDTLNNLPENIKKDDPTLKDIIATISSLKQTVIIFKNAVIAGDHGKTESLRADFAPQVALAKRKIIKNRIDFLKNYIKQHKTQENLENTGSEIKNNLINL